MNLRPHLNVTNKVIIIIIMNKTRKTESNIKENRKKENGKQNTVTP